MKAPRSVALILVAWCAVVTGAHAAKVYKCGTTYSQVPCADAVELNTATGPTALRQREAQKAVEQEKKAAKGMEKDRLAEEKAAAKAQQDADKARKAAEKEEEKQAAAEKKKAAKEPAIFTAKVPSSKASQPK